MTLEYSKAFDLITEKVEAELAKSGFTREKVSGSGDKELVALFTSENVAYSVLYTVDKQQMILRTCPMTEDGPDNDWKTLSTWLYDDVVSTQKDAESIGNDFVDGVSNSGALKRAKQTKSKKKKGDDGNADPRFLAKRFVVVFPELKEEIQMEEDCYDPFRGATFAKEHIAPKLAPYINSPETSNKDLEKLGAIFSTQYGNGDVDTRAIITTVLINSLDDAEYQKLAEHFNDELRIAAKFARKYKDKEVKPEVVKVKKQSKFTTLRDQQG